MCSSDLANVGIIRNGTEVDAAIDALETLTERANNVALSGGRQYNPGWNLATDLPSMLTVSKCTARGARDRKESRGGHTREDFPGTDAQLATVNIAHTMGSGDWRGDITTSQIPLLAMPADLKALLEEGK